MKTIYSLLVTAAALAALPAALAQAPSGSTGQCKDGSYTQAASKSGACRGHQGIKEWYAAPSATAATPAKPATAATAPAKPAATAPPAPSAPAAAPAPAAKPAPAAASSNKMSPQERAATMTQAAGGGPGLVWFNSDSKVYHCPGSTYYGKTKQGSYMSEADAKAKGGHADHNHPCTK